MTRVDTDLQAIVFKALAKEPERRYSSAAALAEDLERYRHSQLRLGGELNPDVQVDLLNLAQRGRLAEAERLLTESVALLIARLGPEAMNTNFVYSSLARVHRERGQYATAVRELSEARVYLGKIMGDASPNLFWLYIELAGALGAEGPSREADSLFVSIANAPNAQSAPNDMLRFHVNHGPYLAKVGRHAEAEKYLLLAEQALREPKESRVRHRLLVLDALVDLERAWGARAPSAARTAALKRWTAVRDAEAPELKKASEEGRVPGKGSLTSLRPAG